MMVRMLCGRVCEHVCDSARACECERVWCARAAGGREVEAALQHPAKLWVPKSAFSSLVLGR